MMNLASPSKTKIAILEGNPFDIAVTGFENQTILSLATWDENPIGRWSLELEHSGNAGYSKRPFMLKGIV